MELNAELLRAAEQFGSQFGCSPALHPDDHLMSYVVTYSQRSVERGPAGGLSEFFENGAKDAQQIKNMAKRFRIPQTCAVLEFACGYGRVSRHLSSFFQDFTCSDIHTDAVRFLRDQMELNAIMSAANPKDFSPRKTFDFIFVLSLFSHLPDHLFGPWLGRLYELLNPGGALLFTTHGETAMKKEPLLALSLTLKTGYGFLSSSDQSDLDSSIYGSSITMPYYVRDKILIETHNIGQIIDFSPGVWWEMQDQWIVQKPHNTATTFSLACD